MRDERCRTCDKYERRTNGCSSDAYCDGEVKEIINNSIKCGITNAIGKIENILYHKAFEEDSDMQKWDSGCWIRYKLFEEAIEEARKELEVE